MSGNQILSLSLCHVKPPFPVLDSILVAPGVHLSEEGSMIGRKADLLRIGNRKGPAYPYRAYFFVPAEGLR